MKSSPRRPLILKRRKLSLPQGDPPSTLGRDDPNCGSPKQEQARTNKHEAERQEPEIQEVRPGIKSPEHPTMPNAQELSVSPNADIQNVLEALRTEGKESDSNGPNKFILSSSEISSSIMETRAFKNENNFKNEHYAANSGAQGEDKYIGQNSGGRETSTFCATELLSVEEQDLEGNGCEVTSSGLDSSLTNIQWLGRMSSSGMSQCNVKKETEKENQTPKQKTIKAEEDSAVHSSTSSWQESFTERPPYSYMAMIQFAINSTEKKRMMLKDIYTWIEDHFPYFKHVAKPGWKNSIRHNLSLHDMFVRETSANGKISFWTIHPEANRYLTLDQVFKQQKRHSVDLQKTMGCCSSSKSGPQIACRKMKPLLPRVTSYLVPVQFPVSQSLILQTSSTVPLPTAQGASENSSRQVRIAPKVSHLGRTTKVSCCNEDSNLFSSPDSIKEEAYCDEGSSLLSSHQTTKEDACLMSREPAPSALYTKEKERSSSSEWASLLCPVLSVKEEPTSPREESNVCLPGPSIKQKRESGGLKSPLQSILSDTLAIKRPERHRVGKSRRKQHLALSCLEEPVLLLPSNGSSDSSTLGYDLSFEQETCPLGNLPHLNCSPGEGGSSRTPMKEMLYKLPVSSTPGKTTVPSLALTDTWRSAPSFKETSGLDFSPVRTPSIPLQSLQENTELLGFSSTPPRQSLCDSPHLPFLDAEANAMVSGPLTSSPARSKPSSPELQDSILPESRSLLEGLVLDTMNDSLSKILLDVSFPVLEDDSLGPDLSWSHLIPELK